MAEMHKSNSIKTTRWTRGSVFPPWGRSVLARLVASVRARWLIDFLSLTAEMGKRRDTIRHFFVDSICEISTRLFLARCPCPSLRISTRFIVAQV